MPSLLEFVVQSLQDAEQLAERIDEAGERPRLVWELALADELIESETDDDSRQELSEQIEELEQRLGIG